MERSRSQHFAVLIRDAGRAYVDAQTTPARSAAFEQLRCAVDLAKAETPSYRAPRAPTPEPDSSPIESMMQAAIFAALPLHGFWAIDQLVVYGDTSRDRIKITREKPTLIYWADITIDDGTTQLVIECDGHDFHNVTKEQAAHDRRRDRRILLEGTSTIRFTGSEIIDDAARCAHEALAIFRKLATRGER